MVKTFLNDKAVHVKYAFSALLAVLAIQAPAQTDIQEISIPAKDGVELKGTLTVPDKGGEPVPLVITIAGSGSPDRDGNQKRAGINTDCLKMTAEELEKAGVASLRFDKRGAGESVMPGIKEENMTFDDYISDTRALVDKYYGDKRFSRIILLGHSEGALIAFAAAANNPKVGGLITVAGAGRNMADLLKEQLSERAPQILVAATPIIDSLKAGRKYPAVPAELNALFRPSVQPFLISCMKYEPTELIKQVKCPILVVQGDMDIQVLPKDAEALCAANPLARKALIEGMNHVLKDTDTKDLQVQLFKTYMNPSVPLSAGYVKAVTAFAAD